tara:strand:- start:13465 stop:14958 length:1494 start_codon:yes stop_codon:yes gene_type:complete
MRQFHALIRVLKLITVLVCTVLCAVCNASDKSKQADVNKKPNVVMIIVDDLNDWIGAMEGHPNAKTPNIDRLASQGMLFTNAHSTAALCGPSRASIMTGLRPTTTGIYWHIKDKDIKKASPATKGIAFLPEYFGDHGYKTMGIGKIFHNSSAEGAFEQYGGRIKGFGPKPDKAFAWDSNGTNTDWGVFPEKDEDMIDYKSAIWAIDKIKEDHHRPFLLTVGFIRPHAPWYAPQKYFDLNPLEDIITPPYLATDMNDVPQISKAIHEMPMMPTTDWAIKNGEWAKAVQGYLASISFVDQYVGEILDELEQSPYRDNTIVVLWSDHGYHLGEKGRFAKHSVWEEATHVPFIIKSPETLKGQKLATPVSLLDLYPTLLDIAGLPAYDRNEGTSLKPLLTGDANTSGRPAITTYGEGNHSIRGERYRYIRYSDGSEELYDHDKDPEEWTNLALNKEYADIKKRFIKHLPINPAPISEYIYGNAVNEHFEKKLSKYGITRKK